MTDVDLGKLRSRAERATPGPWRWGGYANPNSGGVRLDAMIPGTPCVMMFRRRGMRGAEPVFFDRSHVPLTERHQEAWKNGKHNPARDVIVLEASYRDDVVDLDTPDAQFMAAADPTTILALLDRIDELETENRYWKSEATYGPFGVTITI